MGYLAIPKVWTNDSKGLNPVDVCGEFLSKMLGEQDIILEDALRNNAVPPIKGEITKGKVNWRGIKMIRKTGHFEHELWLEQRGKRISKIIKMVYKL